MWSAVYAWHSSGNPSHLVPALRSRPLAMSDDTPIRLIARFRAAGWRYPFGASDAMEVWRGQECLGEVPALLVTQVLAHYVQGAMLTQRVQQALREETPPPIEATPPRPPAPIPRLRAALNRKLRGRDTHIDDRK